MKATYKKKWVTLKTGKGNIEVEINPGEFVFGRNAAAKELKMAPSTVRNRMAKLKKLLNLDIKEDKQYSIVSIINWDTYQTENKKEDIKEDKQRTSKGQAKDTNNKDNKDNKKEKKIYKRKTLLPDNYCLTDKHIKYAESKNITTGIEDIFEDFCINHRKRGTQWVSWDAAWQTWIRNKVKWDKEKMPQDTYEPTIEELIS